MSRSSQSFNPCPCHLPTALPPEITVAPEPVARTVDGRDVTLTCRTFGAPKPIVKWFHDNDELTGGRYLISSKGDLTIRYGKNLNMLHFNDLL